MKIFADRSIRPYKIAGLILFGLLLVWFTLNLTGLKLGEALIVESCFRGEPIDVLFWAIYAASFVLFLLCDKAGKFVIGGYVFLWGVMQASVYFKSAAGIHGYNETFASTHRLFAPSDTAVVKDTYHMVLDILILAALCYAILYIAVSAVKSRKSSDRAKQRP